MADTSRKQMFSRGCVVFPLLLTVLVLFTDAKTAYISRLNYLKSRVEYYLLNFQAGKALYDRQNFVQAARYYELLIAKSKESDLFYASLGFCRYHLGDFDRAFQAYEFAFSRQPHIYTYAWDLGMMSYALGNYSNAVKYLNQSLEEVPWTARLVVGLAEQKNTRQGQPGGASGILSRFRERAAQDEIHAIHILAQSYDRLENYGKMLQVATLGLRRHGPQPLLLFDQALALLRMGQYKAAESIFSAAIAKDPLGGRVYHYRSLARNHLADTAAAEEDEALAVRLGMKDPDERERFPLHINFDLIYLLYQS
jgi:tetratricopeptide (TPR) repeat protein